jgi:hypothetical protein
MVVARQTVTALGDAQHGLPNLSGADPLVIRETTILAGAWIVIADTTRQPLAERQTLRHTSASVGDMVHAYPRERPFSSDPIARDPGGDSHRSRVRHLLA